MKLLQKITSVFLAFVFTLSSLGFTIGKMECLKSGKTKISFTQAKECCPEKKTTTPVLKSKCCNIFNSSLKLKDHSIAIKNIVPQADQILLVYTPSLNYSIYNSSESFLSFYTTSPPPIIDRDIFSLFSVFRI